MANELALAKNEPAPLVHIKNGAVFANSRDVAAYFGKEHRDVLRTIDRLIAQEATLGLRNFAHLPHTGPSGSRQYRSFGMDRAWFTLLAMGFTGAKARRSKLRYMEAFDALEAEVHRLAQFDPTIDLDDPVQLRGLLTIYCANVEKLERRVEELLPYAAALDRLGHAAGSLCITGAAKALQMRPKDLFNWLRRNGWISKPTGSGSYLGHESHTAAGFLEHKVTTAVRGARSERVTEQVRVTASGLIRLALLVKPAVTAR